jgi:hypothetical protein
MSRRVLAGAVVGALVACVAITLVEGRPRHLPGVALGSPMLLHAERALALSTSGLRYEAEAADHAAAAVTELQEQYDDQLAVIDALADRLDAPQRRP